LTHFFFHKKYFEVRNCFFFFVYFFYLSLLDLFYYYCPCLQWFAVFRVTLLTVSKPGQSCQFSDWLQVRCFGFRTSIKESNFVFSKTCPPQPHKMRTVALSGGKRQRRGIDHPLPSSAEVNTKQSYNSAPLRVLHCMLEEEFIFTYVCIYVYCTNTVLSSALHCCFLPLHCVLFFLWCKITTRSEQHKERYIKFSFSVLLFLDLHFHL
jgi:hypothetical protein